MVPRRALIAAAALAVATGCGSSADLAGEPSPSGHDPRVLTEDDAGTSIVLAVGETIEVKLGAEFYVPEAQGDALKRTAGAGGYPSGQPATATFVAVKPGTAELSATDDYACLHATPQCGVPQRLWNVHVKVTG